MHYLYMIAREQGKYEAIGGHKARASLKQHPTTGRTLCGVCGRQLTWREDRHAGRTKAAKRG